MPKKVVKKIVNKTPVKNKSTNKVDMLKFADSTKKDISNLKQDTRSIKVEMLAMEGRLRDFVMNLSEEQYRGFIAVYEDTNDRIKAVAEMRTEIIRILDKLDRVDETVYYNHAPRIVALETVVKN